MMMKNMTYLTYCLVLIFSSKIIPFHLALLFFNSFFSYGEEEERRDIELQFEGIFVAFLQTQGALSLGVFFLFSTKLINSD